ncbi:MAG: threonine/serine exporter [Ruminococcaceae bacterium]|nr:threonine/serine exporter [Oscillospiraceae bacterium]
MLGIFLRIITSMTSAFGFAMIFRVRGKNLVAATIGGFLCGLVFEGLSLFCDRQTVCYFVTTLVLSVYAELMARILKAPVTSFLPATIVPLVPGGALYYAMTAILQGDMNTFVGWATSACYIALAITAGIMVVTPVRNLAVQMWLSLRRKEGT